MARRKGYSSPKSTIIGAGAYKQSKIASRKAKESAYKGLFGTKKRPW